ncbi:unnamed protein product [Paramecium octaurelia]|uniref:Uncharacterized protein n=1 Tax=Paramecium octaurelia TaxID=43137 RepID=A0A8S1VBL4_PAROT|nr:unnamed protein product [Paramecium octaurelia]
MNNNKYNSFILENKKSCIQVISSSRAHVSENEIQIQHYCHQLSEQQASKIQIQSSNQSRSKQNQRTLQYMKVYLMKLQISSFIETLFNCLKCMIGKEFNFISLYNFD